MSLRAVLLLASVSFLGAQTSRRTPAERYQQFQQNFARRAEALTANQFQNIHNLQDWQRRRPAIRTQLLGMLGLQPLPPRTPLNVRITGGFTRDAYRVENIVFESLPNLFVTGNLYLPSKVTGKLPTIVYVSGHAPSPHGAKVAYQHHGQWFARNGYVALVLDTIEFAEIAGIHHGTHNLNYWYWLSLGYTPAGVEVWNAIRALDYLETRPEVDRTRFGMTGRSGGGAITWFTASVDDRIKAAVPVHGTWSVGSHVRDDVVRENCDCIYFWNSCQLDLPITAALIAPRPLKIINASKDGMFPPTGYDKVHDLLKPVYQWFHVPDKLAAYAEPTGHSDTPAYRREANEWLNRWLKNDPTPFDESSIVREPAELLTVLKQIPAHSRNEGIHRSFIAAAKPQAPKTLAAWNARKAQLLETLRSKIFQAFPSDPGPFHTWKQPSGGWTNNYAQSFRVEFNTETDLRIQAELFVPRTAGPHPALIYIKGKDDLVYNVDYDDLLSAFSTHVVLVLRPRAVDYPMDNFRVASAKMSAALLGTTIESLQLWDVLRAAEFLTKDQNLPIRSIATYGRREMGILGLYAAALNPAVARIVLDNPPASHWDAPAFLNILRHTDLNEVAGMLAPREIVSLSPLPPTFNLTRAIHQLDPKSRPFRTVTSLGDALRPRI
jgi:cephalosporin-C deacetylase-like acetyl esterase